LTYKVRSYTAINSVVAITLAKAKGNHVRKYEPKETYGVRRRRQKVMEHFSELKKSFQKRPISQQNLLINICETYNLDLLSKFHFNPSV
jgi:hypothetical protein